MSTTLEQHPAWRILLAWVLATVVPGLIALVLAGLPHLDTPDYQLRNDNAVGSFLEWSGALALYTGILVGAAQAVILKWLRLSFWWLWTVATLSGTFVATGMYVFTWLFLGHDPMNSEALDDAIHAVLFIFPFACSQAFIILLWTRKVGWWWLFVMAGWLLGNQVAELLTGALLPGQDNFYPFTPRDTAFIWGVGWCVRLLVVSTVTGLGLSWLLRPAPDK